MGRPLDFEAMERAAGVVFSTEHRERIQQAVDTYRALASGAVKAADVRECARRVHNAAKGLLDLGALSDEGPAAAALRVVLIGSGTGFLAPLGTVSDLKERARRERDLLVRLRDGAKTVLGTFKGRDGRTRESVRRDMLLSTILDIYQESGGELHDEVGRGSYAKPLFGLVLEILAQVENVTAISGPTTVDKMLRALVQRRKSK